MKVKVGNLAELKPIYKGITCKSTKLITTLEAPGPVPWKLVAELDHKDVLQIIASALRPSILLFLISGFFIKNKNDEQDFE